MRRRMIGFALAAAGAMFTAGVQAQVPRTDSVAGAAVYFIQPQEGATVKSPFKVVMGLRGMGIAPAGVDMPETGHHHLLVDLDKLPDENMPIPTDDHHRHFGKGQTETTLTLPPGKHTLQLLLADRNHIPHRPPVVSQKITIEVAP